MKHPPTTISRRTYLKTAAAGVAACAVGSGFSANSKLQHACIGVGGMMGGGNLGSFLEQPRAVVAAICDVDDAILAAAGARAPEARRYSDWREMLDREGDRIDSVNVTVPDHMHAAITMAALAKGKHVYCQKPMAHDVAEVRAMTLAAAKAGTVTQLGNQF